jgi:hypothetical protein
MNTSLTASMVPRTTPTLDRVLDAELAFSPSVQRYFSNHMAMVLVALHQLGAAPNDIKATFDDHVRRRPERRDDRDMLDARIEEVALAGIATIVRDRVPALASGPSSQLFHPMIRLGYALDAGHGGQVAAALLDWERRHQVFPAGEVPTGTRRLRDVANILAARPAGTWPHTFDLDGTARRPELRDALAGIRFDEHTLDDVSSFALAAHVTADDFITLHLVTGARALRTVIPHVDHEVGIQLAAHSAVVMAVAYAAVGAPALLTEADLDAIRLSDLPNRSAIASRAIADDDPHVIKLANVALVEEMRTSDPLYRFAAARVVGLLST